MDKQQAEIVADAILEPARRKQIEEMKQLEERQRRSAEKGRNVMSGLVGAVIGAAVGYFTEGPVSLYGGVGSGLGFLIGAVVTRIRSTKDA